MSSSGQQEYYYGRGWRSKTTRGDRSKKESRDQINQQFPLDLMANPLDELFVDLPCSGLKIANMSDKGDEEDVFKYCTYESQ